MTSLTGDLNGLCPRLGGLIVNIMAPGIDINLGKISRTISFWCLDLSSQGIRDAKINAELTLPGSPEKPGATIAKTVFISPLST